MSDTRRENLKAIFEDTQELYEIDEYLRYAIKCSIADQYVLFSGSEISLQGEPYDKPAEIVVSTKRTIEAAECYKDSRVCILNFASAKNPGGGVVNGASAQEECICRISTLYPCLANDDIMNKFYIPHRAMFTDTLYNDDLIFTPGVVCLKTDEDIPSPRRTSEWFTVDVITCASPNLSSHTKVSDEELEQIQLARLERVFLTAINEGAEVLILGAFGCGAFRNPPKVVARAMKQLTDKYAAYFKTIEFAVYCPPNKPANYEAFREVFGK